MQWHEHSRAKDRALRYPTDSEAWKKFNALYVYFSAGPQNVRLALSTDNFYRLD